MTFLVPLGLLVALSVVGPLVAHLLRRRRPEERVFAPARLVPPAPPVARRRARLEDRALLGVRVVLIAALALLAASPLVRCSRLSLDRRGGASIALAIVIDDSLSMHAPLPPGQRRSGATTRFELAMVAARELAGSLRSGDYAAIILASSPPRVLLPPTGDATSVRATLDQLAADGCSDGGTDLDAALVLAATTLRELAQPDHRVVLLSDLADGAGTSGALGLKEDALASLEVPLDALRAPPPMGIADCAVLAATPEGTTDAVRVRVACALQGTAVGKRTIELVLTDATSSRVGIAAFPPSPPSAPATFEVVVAVDRAKMAAQLGVPPQTVTLGEAQAKPTLLARITGEADAIPRDDVAPVLGAATAPAVGVVVGEGGALDEVVATGGAPILERAFTALESGTPIRPLPSLPDREVDLAALAGLAVDDPSGLGPEQRIALSKWLDTGGVLLVAAGPRTAAPPLGSSLEPLLMRAVRWEKVTVPLGVDPARAGPLADGVQPPVDLAAHGRALLDREDIERFAVRTAWKDGAPLLLTRAIGQGEAWVVTLPFAPDVSDLPLHPSFLAMLDAFLGRVRDRGAGVRLEIGKSWSVGLDDGLEVIPLDEQGKPRTQAIPSDRVAGAVRARPRTLGAYLVTVSPRGRAPRREVRAVVPIPREVDLTVRPLAPTAAAGEKSGVQRKTLELAPTLALALTVLAVIELLARGFRLFAAQPEPEKVAD